LFFLFFAFFGAVSGVIGYAIGNSKGKGAAGFWLGFFLGFIGWIIVATMPASTEVQMSQAMVIADAVRAGGTADAATLPCPWCAEPIRLAAKVCRHCGRDVEPTSALSQSAPAVPPRVVEPAEWERIRTAHPRMFDVAFSAYEGLPVSPTSPDAWVEELCNRLDVGSPLNAAVTNIPLDWDGSVRAPRRSPTLLTPDDLRGLDDLETVRKAFPGQYDAALGIMKRLNDRPENPAAWLYELCNRAAAGSPLEAAAGRIPLTWPHH
jgi:hypothetical protein